MLNKEIETKLSDLRMELNKVAGKLIEDFTKETGLLPQLSIGEGMRYGKEGQIYLSQPIRVRIQVEA